MLETTARGVVAGEIRKRGEAHPDTVAAGVLGRIQIEDGMTDLLAL